MSRDDARRHQRILEEVRRTQAVVEQSRPGKSTVLRFLITTVIAAGAALIIPYVYGPDLEAVDVNVQCPLCDQNNLTPPLTAEDGSTGALFNIKIRNLGQWAPNS